MGSNPDQPEVKEKTQKIKFKTVLNSKTDVKEML